MNFREQQNAIISFIKNEYPAYLPDELKNFELTTEFLDFDRFKKDFTIFTDFMQIKFGQSPFKDDCEDIEHLNITVYLVHRNNTSAILQSNNLDTAYAFYKMVKDNPRLGVAENTIIESMDFYNYAEGNKYLVVSEIVLSLQLGL
jgi:hypothetical protein